MEADGTEAPCEHQLRDLASGVTLCCDLALKQIGNRNKARGMFKMMREAAACRLPDTFDWPDVDEPPRVVLVVDDNPLLLVSLEHMLRESGHTVLAAHSWDAALRLAALAGDALEVLVTDLTVGDARGQDLASHLRESHAGLQVVYVSASKGAEADAPDLEKPLCMGQLIDAIRV